MQLRHSADVRTLGYMVFLTALLVLNWSLPFLHPLHVVTWPLALFGGVTVAVMAHNHTHLKMWKGDGTSLPNVLTDWWITCFYGYPVFAWIPTHNRNHHQFTNKPGDHTATWRLTEKNNLLTVITYPALSAWWQRIPTNAYLGEMWREQRGRFWLAAAQYVVLATFLGIGFFLDWRKALAFMVAPGAVGLYTVLLFNYVQHIHADELSEYSHSRNIVGPGLLNTLLFNNGFHTIHHINPNLHWSETPAAHAEIAHLIDPRLNEPTFLGMMWKFYVRGTVDPSTRSVNMRAERAEEGAFAAK